MQNFSAGKEVLNYCSKCKLMLAATIASTLNGRPAKVQCRTCKTEQKYKAQKPGTASKRRAPKSKKAEVPLQDMWRKQLEELQEEQDPTSYTIRKHFDKNIVLNHPKFGLGVVQQVLEGDKIEVLFRYELKTLVHNK